MHLPRARLVALRARSSQGQTQRGHRSVEGDIEFLVFLKHYSWTNIVHLLAGSAW